MGTLLGKEPPLQGEGGGEGVEARGDCPCQGQMQLFSPATHLGGPASQPEVLSCW